MPALVDSCLPFSQSLFVANIWHELRSAGALKGIGDRSTRSEKNQGEEIDRKPEAVQLMLSQIIPGLVCAQNLTTETAATLLDSEHCCESILDEFLIVYEPLSCAFNAHIPS